MSWLKRLNLVSRGVAPTERAESRRCTSPPAGMLPFPAGVPQLRGLKDLDYAEHAEDALMFPEVLPRLRELKVVVRVGIAADGQSFQRVAPTEGV